MIIPLLIGAAIGSFWGAFIYAKIRKAKDRKHKTSNKPTAEKPYKMKHHKLTEVSGVSWTPENFRSHLKDLAQSMGNLDDLSFVRVDYTWKAKDNNRNKNEVAICNLKTLLEFTKSWNNVHSISSITVYLVEILEPKLEHPHKLTDLDQKILDEIQETEDYRLRVAKMKAKHAERNI